MSRSNNTELRNPAEKFFKWDGDKGGFKYYDKTKGEHGENVKVSLPFRFMVLDALSTIVGYDDATASGYWSNEVRDLRVEPFVVRTSKGICFKGLYSDLDQTGAKYAQSVYVAYQENEAYHLGNIKMVGAALGAWIEFRKKNKVFSGMICVNDMLDGKKGKTEYKIPVFSSIEVTAELNDVAVELDKQLQEYLSQYLSMKKKEDVENASTAFATTQEPIHDDTPMPTKEPDEILPF